VTAHLSRRELEQLVADDPAATVAPVLRVHVADCDRCAVRRLALEAARSRYLERYPAREFARAVVERAARAETLEPARSRKTRVVVPMVASLAIAAGALLWLQPSFESTAIRTKGSVSLDVVVQHAGAQRRLRDGDALAPGAQLAFSYALDRPRHLLLLGVDDAGQVTRYYPADPAHSIPLQATGRAQLPIGVELDARKGQERLYALFSIEPLDEGEVRNAIQRTLVAERARGGGIATMSAIRVSRLTSQRTLWFRKP
jgi:Domain of unknown function (DUF4384)